MDKLPLNKSTYQKACEHFKTEYVGRRRLMEFTGQSMKDCMEFVKDIQDKNPTGFAVQKMTPEQKEANELLKVLSGKGVSLKDIKSILNQRPKVEFDKIKMNCHGRTIRVGVISDSHIGHKCYRPDIMDAAVKVFGDRKVDFITHVGDICEGMYTNRQGHVYELSHIGGDAQVEFAINELNKFKDVAPLHFITGNHSSNTFFKLQGFDIGLQIAKALPFTRYIGCQEGDINIDGKIMRLAHPDGGSSYAISYKSQKMIESFEGGHKPNILLIGHFHKAEYIFYRNVHCVQAGTLENQTSFMRNSQLAAHVGFWVLEIRVTENGVEYFSPTFYPYYT